MKRLIVAVAVAAMAAGAFAAEAEAAPKAGDGAQAAPAAAAAEAPAHRARPAGMAFDRAKFEERMKKRQEERRAKVAEILRAAGLQADKVDATAEEIDKVYARRPPQRPPRMVGPNGAQRRPPRQRPQGVPAKE